MANRGAEKYGKCYWCIGSPDAPDGEIYAYADRIEVGHSGELMLIRQTEPNLILAPGRWRFCYAASVLDGSAVAVEHWTGQIVEAVK